MRYKLVFTKKKNKQPTLTDLYFLSDAEMLKKYYNKKKIKYNGER